MDSFIVLLKIIIVNLMVSCDNIGVIALASRNLPEKKARLAGRLGLWASFFMKLGFVFITHFLFGIPWLHIRVIGGVILLYVTFHMLHQSAPSSRAALPQSGEGFFHVIFTIITADIGMSLDNVLAVLSIAAAGGQEIGLRETGLIMTGFLVCMPLLLWFSGLITDFMEGHPALTYLCAGYLVFTAVNMIFEDETVALFLASIHLDETSLVSVLSGILVFISCLYIGGAGSKYLARRRQKLTIVFTLGAFYALIMVTAICYLDVNPVIEGIKSTALFHFIPLGSNAVYTMKAAPHLFALAACWIVGILADNPAAAGDAAAHYKKTMLQSMGGMILFILLYIGICTLGLSAVFGFGRSGLFSFLINLLLQIALYCTYISFFCMLKTFVRHRATLIMAAMISIHLENVLADIFMYQNMWPFLSGYFPGFYLFNYPEHPMTVLFFWRILFCISIGIILTTWIGSRRFKDK